MIKSILVLDDIRSFLNTENEQYIHLHTNQEAIDALKKNIFDEIWIDWDLSSTDKKFQTSEPFVRDLAEARPPGVQIRTITDMPEYAAKIALILEDLQPQPIITTIGARWNAEHNIGPEWVETDEQKFLTAAGITTKSERHR